MNLASRTHPFIPIEGSLNFRDFGGYLTAEGQQIAQGRLFRCGMLSDIPAHAFADFSALGIDVICDLRREDETEMSPTPLGPPFEGRRHIPIAPGTSHELRNSMMMEAHSAEERSELMRVITREIATDWTGAYKDVMTALLETKQGFLIHCTAGRDRTGFGVAIIQLLLGVSHDDVYRDYLLTNQSNDLIERIRHRMAEQQIDIDEGTLEVIARVRRPYLEAALEGIETEFGGLRGYLEAVGVGEIEIDELKSRYLVPI
jgi:protein-tyrosine phosphatase